MSESMRLLVKKVDNKDSWDMLVNQLGGNPFQLWGWGELKAETGAWEAVRLAIEDSDRAVIGGAQVLLRTVPFPFRRVAYVPRGPFGNDDALVNIADAVAMYIRAKYPAVSIIFEPAVGEDFAFTPHGGLEIDTTILLPHTLILDLRNSEDDLMAAMGKKTRYDVRRSLRDGLEVERVTDAETLEEVLDIYEETGHRADFDLHNRDYYRMIFSDLSPYSALYVAKVDGEVVAFNWMLASANTGVELYGGSNQKARKARANAGLKWFAITDMKRNGVRHYDLNGLLGEGISQFKRGFASHETMLHGPVEVPLSPLYPLWSKMLPKAREWMSKAKDVLRSAKQKVEETTS